MIQIGDIVTMDVEDRRWFVRWWCFLARKPLPMRRRAYQVTHMTSVGGWVSVK